MTEITSRRELRPRAPEGAAIGHVCVSPDLRRLAFSRADADAPGVYVEEIATGGPPALVCGEDVPIEGIAFSPDGVYVAYLVGSEQPTGRERTVGWAEDAAEGELGRVGGAAFAWTPKGSLLVADLEQEQLVQYNALTAVSRDLMPLSDAGDIALPPRIVVSPKGKRIAVVCRRPEDAVTEVWILERDAGQVKSRLLTQVPGLDASVSPFWSPKGMTLGLGVVHPTHEQSAIIAVRRLKGEGEILYERELLDPAAPPAWAPSGDSIAFFMAEGPSYPELGEAAAQRLALLDCRTRELRPLAGPRVEPGAPVFLDRATLLVEGGAAATLFTFDAPP
jgi:dipeptidyl aminopeptidase/acylaminoacyl peptidase